MKFLNAIDGADKVVTSDAQQFISKAEKDKLTGIQAGALNNPHPATHPYSMITGTPASLPANGGHALSATHLLGDDTRAVNSPPSDYLNGGARYQNRAGWQTEFKLRATIDTPPLSGTYVYLKTLTPWSDPSGGFPIQMVYGNGVPHWRVGISTTAWSSWMAVNDGGNAATVSGFTVGTNVPANAKFTDTVVDISGKANNSTKIIAGNGLVGGGTLGADTTVTLGTPMGISSSTNNSITTTGHTHELTLTKADITNLGIPAADTNTTYSEISEAEINAGTSSTLRTISGRRVKYIMDNTPIYHVGNVDTANKQLLWINTNL